MVNKTTQARAIDGLLASLGDGLLQDGPMGQLIRKSFPEASQADLYGVCVVLDKNFKPIALKLNGKTVQLANQ